MKPIMKNVTATAHKICLCLPQPRSDLATCSTTRICTEAHTFMQEQPPMMLTSGATKCNLFLYVARSSLFLNSSTLASAMCIRKYQTTNAPRFTKNMAMVLVAPVAHCKALDQEVEIKTPIKVQTDLLMTSQDTFLMSASPAFNMCMIVIPIAKEPKSMIETSKLASLSTSNSGASAIAPKTDQDGRSTLFKNVGKLDT